MSVPVLECGHCGRLHFPDPWVCPSCHSTELAPASVDHATVEHMTTSPGAAQALATLVAPTGLRLIARVPPTAEPGAVLSVTTEPTSQAGAYVPV